ncbi:MAG: hypothetical protein ACK4PN_08575 [Allorhizobium sp.]
MTASLPAAQSPARALIARLEALAEEQDELHRRLLDALKSYAEASELYLEAVERQIERTALARGSVIAEAAFLEHERDQDAAGIGRVYSALGHAYPPSRPAPRRSVQ